MSWFTQLRKYIANAIYPNNPEAHSAPPMPPPATAFDTLPLFNENGIQIGFQRVPHNATAQLNMPPALGTLAGPPKIATSTSRPPTAPVVTAPQPRNWTEIPSFDLTNPALQTSFIPLDPQPPSETQLDQGVIATSLENLNELLDTKRVAVHWATKGNSSYNGKGSIHSPDIAGGKVRNKKCLGVLCCTNEDCNYIGRPQVTPGGFQKQLDDQCPSCSSALSHETCASRSYIIQWGQVGNDISTSQYRYINGFAHTHSRIPNVARTTSAEDKRFTSTYSNRPKVTPTQLMVGPAAPEGFGPGAAELGQKFASQAYTGYRLRQEKKKNGNGPTSAFGTFEKLQQWKQKHPDATCKDFVSNDIVCITLQTDWMRQQLMPDMSGVSEPLGGLLTDAAHKYWDDPNGRLIVTSIYSPLIQKWVPYHFLILIESIAEVAAERGISISDEHLVGVVDFSDPERIGFQDAYCTYFLAQPNDPRLEEQLRAAAKKLLKGCLYHYLKAVERIAKMSTMVDPNTKSEFRALAASLPKLQTLAEFHDAVLQIRQKWPRASSWLNWWLNIDHAAMLFECMRAMPSHLASKLPETTNPEEAIHATIHRAVGKNHPFFAGLDGLLVVIKWYRQQVQNAQLGIKNHYGKSGQEVRKALKAKFGTTHPSRKYPKAKARERRKGRNEGNPPYRPRKTISRLRRSKNPIISPLRKRNHLAKSSTHHRSSHQLVNSESSTDSTYLPESHTHSDSSTSLDSASVNDLGSDAPPNPSKEQSTLIGAQQKLRHMSPSKLNAKSAESQFHAIQLSTMHELPGPAWTNNSCWLDSSMEALFCPMAFYGSLAEFKSIITTAKEDPSSPSPLYCLYLAFQFRMAEGINKFQRPSLGPVSPFRQPAEEITNIRDAFRKVLHETHTVEGKVGAYQMPLGWLDNLLPNNSPACDFFKPHKNQPIPALDSPNWISCSTSSKRSREYNFTSSGVPTKLFVDAPFPTLDGPSGDDFQLGDPTYLSDDSESITHLLLSTLENEFTSPAPVISTGSNLSISSSPLPSSPHHILCRCGVESNGYRESIEQMTVQCAICKNYTHTGCITMRFNGQIPKHFECDDCRFPEVQHVLRDGFAHFRNTLPGLRKQKLASIANRLFPGKGILTGTVEMWRGIQSPAAARGIIDNVSLPDIVDGLWQDQDGRRTIRLGSYIRPLEEQIHKQEAEDDLLVNPTTVRCSGEIAARSFSLKQVPALALQNSKDLIGGNATYYTGGLLATQVAEINNWIHTKIPMADKLDINMMLRPTIGHARTLVVAHLFRSEFMGDIEDGTLEQKVLEKAWKRLKDWTGRTTTGKPRPKIVDVNFEAISLLDKIMFDESERAGAAGNHQWGLDIGPHELAWTPQINHHSVTTDKRRDGKDEETLHGKNYDFVAEQYEMERAKERRNNQQARSKAPKRKKPEVTPAEDTSKERKERPTRNPKRTRLHQ
ncbi:hypothetical protein BDP27DRAFT_1429496 [Rhodocollybia butyracea]|uniref:Zinc finger PHD-type domain-containing protein n=1 Tax=Rhodocollybia butyracea TaxID=206335 RepID=A0A9P5PDV3_9AGAR|nr:hypothetical protein BDP27DRAFT_1429496 [Rhodocollybia butyracea]